MLISFVKDYVKHRLTAKGSYNENSHYTQLLDNVIYDTQNKPVYNDIEEHKRGLLPQSRRKGNRPKADQLLYRLAQHYKPKHIIEIGTGRGVSRTYLTRALPNAKITSLEHDGSLKHFTAKLKNVDFAFINYYNPAELLTCFEMLLPKLGHNSVLAICNVYGSPLAKQNFQMIKAHPQVTATIDLFWLQLVFFKQGLAKEHFRLRF